LTRFAPGLVVLKHHGPQRTGIPKVLAAPDVVVTSYEVVSGDSGLFNMIEWRAVILDEAQFIRNPEARRTKAVKRLRRATGIAVTGTPVENRLVDVWSIMDFVNPGYLGARADFEARFPETPEAAEQLQPLIAPLMLRRRVADVARDLPELIDIPQVLSLDDDEAEAYERERAAIFSSFGAAATLVSLTSLRRFCAHPALMHGDGVPDDLSEFCKFRRLEEIAEEIFERNEKLLVFTSYTRMADLIASHMRRYFGVYAGVIDGRTPIDDRQLIIDEFTDVVGGAVLILNPKAGGAGLNIVAANHVVHYNPEWNPALQDQATARAFRRGQTRPVTVHRLLIADTVEEVVNERLLRKAELSRRAAIGSQGSETEIADLVAALARSPVQVREGRG
jgi:SNF2 family DNA or RNA helicase